MLEIHETLDAILEQLRALDAPVVRALRPGRSRTEIMRVFESRGLVPSRELELLYEWRNGAPTEPGHYFFPWDFFMSLEEASETYDGLKGVEDPSYWPVFTNLGGDYEYSVCGTEPADTASILSYQHDAGPHDATFRSLGAMLQNLLTCYEEGAFYMADELECDIDRFAEITTRFNPDMNDTP